MRYYQLALGFAAAAALIMRGVPSISAVRVNWVNITASRRLMGLCELSTLSSIFELPRRAGCLTPITVEQAWRPTFSVGQTPQRGYRGIALVRLAGGDLEGATQALEVYTTSAGDQDASAQLILANLYYTMNRPLMAVKAYEKLQPMFAHSRLDGSNWQAMNQRLLVEHIRAGYELIAIGDIQSAQSHVTQALTSDPLNLLALYEQAGLDEVLGRPDSEAMRQLKACHFELPSDAPLIAYLPEVASDLVQRATWQPPSLQAVASYTAWRYALGNSDHPALLSVDDANLLQDPEWISTTVRAEPSLWALDTWNRTPWQDAAFAGGVEMQNIDGMTTRTLRVMAVCIGREAGRQEPHAGYSPAQVPVGEGDEYELSFLYRTEMAKGSPAAVYVAWNPDTPEQVRDSINLAPTEGEWRCVVVNLRAPRRGNLYLNFRTFGYGVTWFAEVILKPRSFSGGPQR